VLYAPTGEVITSVAIKAGRRCFATPAGATGTVSFDDCYVVEGLATAEVTVRRIGAGRECKDISNIRFFTSPAGELSVCNVAGTGVDAGTDFTFTVGEASVVVPAGSCAAAGVFPAGTHAAVTETVPAGMEVESIVCAAAATCSDADLAAATVTVAIGAGSSSVTYTNRRPVPPELCGNALDDDRDGIVDDRCIGGRAWKDLRIDGIQDAGEPGFAGVPFRLRTSDGTLVASTVSDAIGSYHFGDVVAGSYVVEAPLHAMFFSRLWTLTAPNRGSDDSKDSDVEIQLADGFYSTAVFAFPADGVIDHVDAGYHDAND
jgi:hypothetical protein